jgi:hypothetical protein
VWIRIDDNFVDHPKIIRAGPLAIVAQLRALCYCARHLTDGRFPASVAAQICADLAPITPLRMSEEKLWLQLKQSYRVHGYLEYQFSKQKIRELREKKRLAGQAGGLATAQANAAARARTSGTPPSHPIKEASSKKTRAIAPAMDSNGHPTPEELEAFANAKREALAKIHELERKYAKPDE